MSDFDYLDEKPKKPRNKRVICKGDCGNKNLVTEASGGLCSRCYRKKRIAEGRWAPRVQQKSWPGYALEEANRDLLVAWNTDVRRTREVYRRLTFQGVE